MFSLGHLCNLDYKNHVILIDDIRCFGGGWWGDGINLETLKEKILEINQDYSFLREDGYIKEDVLVANIENYDSFEDTLRTYLKKMNKIKGIIQIGANIGQEVEIFEKFTKNILLVEPLPYCKEILKTKYPDYLFLPFAIGTEEGTKKFHVASNGGASSSILKPKLHNKFYPDVDFFLTMDVTVKKFVNIVEEFNIDLDRFNVLFIDTQGSDLDCIKSFESKIRCFDLIVCEIIDVELYENNPNLLHYISYLEKYDFKLSELHGYDGKVGNCFFIKKLL